MLVLLLLRRLVQEAELEKRLKSLGKELRGLTLVALGKRAESDNVPEKVRAAAETKEDLIAAIVAHARCRAVGRTLEPEDEGLGGDDDSGAALAAVCGPCPRSCPRPRAHG